MTDKCDWCKKDLPEPQLEEVMVELNVSVPLQPILSDYGLHCSDECLQREIEEFFRNHPEEVAQDLDDWLALQDSIREEEEGC